MSHMSLPLPPNWSEHRAPSGQLYYYNSRTKESTYIRPPPLPISHEPPKKRKEKLVEKIHIPGTEWLKVRTEEGNVFWNHRETKKSVWVMPEEIKKQVEEWELSLKAPKESAEGDEVQRSKAEEQKESSVKTQGKRKGQESIEKKENKRARVEEDLEEEETRGTDEDEQRAMLDQIAATVEDGDTSLLEDSEEKKDHSPEGDKEPIPDNLSVQESKILFRTLLEEKKIDPLLPWDSSLPLIIRDSRYTALPSLSLRKEVFDEYCRERVRQLRMERVKAQTQADVPAPANANANLPPDSKESYMAFLKETVTSTRTSFTDFKRAHKKDRRFYSFGRDERERERVFKDWLKELGEIKRAMAKTAEENFFKLLEEHVKSPEPNANWKDIKRDKRLSSDPRYDAVGSSSLREDLFAAYLVRAQKRGKSDDDHKVTTTDGDLDETEREKEKERKRQKALAERQSQVQAQKQQLAKNIDRSRAGLERGEAEENFKTLLTDAIRDPLTSWSESLSHLSTDPRYVTSSLPIHMRQRLFDAHLEHLRQRHISSLHSLFTAHSNSIQPLGLGLNERFSTLSSDFLASLDSSLPVVKLKLTRPVVEREFDKWQGERYRNARKELQELLGESNFLEFWGKVGKSAITSETTTQDATVRQPDKNGMDVKIANDDLVGEEDEEVSAVNMREMAKTIDVTEVERVLKNDRRYRVFDYIPEQREQWLRDYMQSMGAHKLSVHTG